MGECNDTVDVGVFNQCLRVNVAAKIVGNRPCHCGRAIDRRQNADVVARSHSTIGAYDAHERFHRGRGAAFGIDAECIVPREIAHRHVVDVHVLPRLDGLARKANNLAVAPNRLAHVDMTRSDLVAGGYGLKHLNAFGFEFKAFDQRLPRDQYIVQHVESDHGVGSGFTACCSYELHDSSLGFSGSATESDRAGQANPRSR